MVEISVKIFESKDAGRPLLSYQQELFTYFSPIHTYLIKYLSFLTIFSLSFDLVLLTYPDRKVS